MKRFSLLIVLGLLVFSCKKDKSNLGEGIEFYLLKNYQITPGQCSVNASSAVLENIPFVSNRDIEAYNTTTFEFTLNNSVIQQIQTFNDGTPYAVTVNKQVIYFAFFKPTYSSSICSPAILMRSLAGNKINLTLSLTQGQTFVDARNDAKLLTALAEQGKLR